MNKSPNWTKAMWRMYDYIFYSNQTKTDRKSAILGIIHYCNLSPREAIQLFRDYEYGAEHGPQH